MAGTADRTVKLYVWLLRVMGHDRGCCASIYHEIIAVQPKVVRYNSRPKRKKSV
jgi:hypothetical protein